MCFLEESHQGPVNTKLGEFRQAEMRKKKMETEAPLVALGDLGCCFEYSFISATLLTQTDN